MLNPPFSVAEEYSFFKEIDHLLTLLDVPHSKDPQSIINATQQWRRKPDQERWEMKAIQTSPITKEKAMENLRHIGLVDEIKPEGKSYNYVLLLGATAPTMQRRLDQVISLWESGIRFENLVFLVSQRPLIDDVDQVESLIKRTVTTGPLPKTRPNTETEAAKMIWQNSDIPAAMRHCNTVFIDTPRRLLNNNEWQRANTKDTLNQWLQPSNKVKPGSALVISDQPHANYQFEVVKQVIPEHFTLSLSAKQAASNTSLRVYLDALALWMHNLPTEKQQPIPISTIKSSKTIRPPAGH